MVLTLGLKFVVITSPARDDLVDGGAEQFYKVTRDIIEKSPDTKVEILIPDFKGNDESLKKSYRVRCYNYWTQCRDSSFFISYKKKWNLRKKFRSFKKD